MEDLQPVSRGSAGGGVREDESAGVVCAAECANREGEASRVYVQKGQDASAEHEAEDARCRARGVAEGKQQGSDHNGPGGCVHEGYAASVQAFAGILANEGNREE